METSSLLSDEERWSERKMIKVKDGDRHDNRVGCQLDLIFEVPIGVKRFKMIVLDMFLLLLE